MKVTDINIIFATIDQLLDDGDYRIEWILGRSLVKALLLQWYLSADTVKANGMDMKDPGEPQDNRTYFSLVWTETKVSCIYDGRATRYENAVAIITYENLTTDLSAMLTITELLLQIIG